MGVTRNTDTQKVVREEELIGVWYTMLQFPWVEVLWFKGCEFQVLSHYGKLFVVKGNSKLTQSLSDIVPDLLRYTKKRLSKYMQFLLGHSNSRGTRLGNKKKVQEYFFDNELSVLKKAIKAYPQLFKTFIDKKRPLIIMVNKKRWVVDDPKVL